MPGELGHSVQILLAEYGSLKTEIHGRSRDQLSCITNSLLASGGLCTAIAISDAKLIFLVLIIPWILSVFGILWCDHHTTIHYIGAYLRRLEKREFIHLLSSNKFSSNYIGWENWFDKQIRKKNKSHQESDISLSRILPIIYFCLPSFLSLIYYLSEKIDTSKTWWLFAFSFDLNLIEVAFLAIDAYLISVFLKKYEETFTSTKFITTDTELEILRDLIFRETDDDRILRMFQELTGVEISKKYLNKIRKEANRTSFFNIKNIFSRTPILRLRKNQRNGKR